MIKIVPIFSKFYYIWLYRSSVCPLVSVFLEVHSLIFPETLQLVRTGKGGKNVPSAFLKEFRFALLAKNCVKFAILGNMPQNGGFSHFYWNPFINFTESLQLIRACKRKKCSKCFFEKNPIFPILATKLAILTQDAQK